jgi:hypothetical protein
MEAASRQAGEAPAAAPPPQPTSNHRPTGLRCPLPSSAFFPISSPAHPQNRQLALDLRGSARRICPRRRAGPQVHLPQQGLHPPHSSTPRRVRAPGGHLRRLARKRPWSRPPPPAATDTGLSLCRSHSSAPPPLGWAPPTSSVAVPSPSRVQLVRTTNCGTPARGGVRLDGRRRVADPSLHPRPVEPTWRTSPGRLMVVLAVHASPRPTGVADGPRPIVRTASGDARRSLRPCGGARPDGSPAAVVLIRRCRRPYLARSRPHVSMRCGACAWNRVLTHVAESGDAFLLSPILLPTWCVIERLTTPVAGALSKHKMPR